jgi:outer membrane protein OmpU
MMRKLLLAGAAALSACLGGSLAAQAQTVVYSENPATAQAPGVQHFNRLAGGGAAIPAHMTGQVAPGTMVVRLNGVMNIYQLFINQGDATTPAASAVGGNKLASYEFSNYARLFPSLEGHAANGLIYGAFGEIRQDNPRGAGGGVYGSISGNANFRGALYWRREYGYIGTDQLGIIRIGSGDQPTSLFLTGVFENFDAGGWNGDIYDNFPSGLNVVYPFEDVGNLYTTDKIVYLSPNINGFDLGLSYEPNTGNLTDTSGCGNFNFQVPTGISAFGGGASAGCDALSSTTVAGELTRRRNTFDGVLRYRGVFGPVGVAATGGFISSGKIQNQTFDYTGVTYDGISIGDFGATATYAGFTVGGHYIFGRFNPDAGWGKLIVAGEPDGHVWNVGVSYQIGPFIVGTNYFVSTGAGNQTPFNNATVGLMTEYGLAYGATYTLTPGFSIYLSGLWGERKEGGYNFITASTSSTGPVGSGLNAQDNNKVTISAIALGESFRW